MSSVGGRVAGAVLAAGSGTRMGTPKAELLVAGERLLDRAVRALRDGGCSPVYAVVRAGTIVADCTAVVNPDPARGQRSSLALAVDAVDAVDAVGAAGVVPALAVVLVDVPGLSGAAVRAVIESWRPGRIAVGSTVHPSVRDIAPVVRRAHPTVMSPQLWRAALELAGPDEGARALLRARFELIDEVPVDLDPSDLDTPADLAAWRAENP